MFLFYNISQEGGIMKIFLIILAAILSYVGCIGIANQKKITTFASTFRKGSKDRFGSSVG